MFNNGEYLWWAKRKIRSAMDDAIDEENLALSRAELVQTLIQEAKHSRVKDVLGYFPHTHSPIHQSVIFDDKSELYVGDEDEQCGPRANVHVLHHTGECHK